MPLPDLVCEQVSGGIFLINIWCGKVQLTVCGQVILDAIRSQAEKTIWSKPGSSVPLWRLHHSCLQVPALNFCLDLPSWWSVIQTYKLKSTIFHSQCFWSVIIIATECKLEQWVSCSQGIRKYLTAQIKDLNNKKIERMVWMWVPPTSHFETKFSNVLIWKRSFVGSTN